MTRVSTATVFGLFFVSGLCALLLQVLWMRELGLLFGVTAQAAAATPAAFFLGLAAGSGYWGRRSDRLARPLRAYAMLEAGVLLASLAYFLLTPMFAAVYGILYDRLVLAQPSLLVLIKLLLALVLLSPAAFFMGGTLPVLSAWLVRHPAALGRSVPLPRPSSRCRRTGCAGSPCCPASSHWRWRSCGRGCSRRHCRTRSTAMP